MARKYLVTIVVRTSAAVSSTKFGTILIFASCVGGACNILGYKGEFFIGRGPVSYEVKNISRTSAGSSTNFRSILIFASCVVGTCNLF